MKEYTQTAGELPDLDPRVSVSRGASSLLLEFSSDATVLYQGPAAAAKTAGALKVLGLPMESSLAPRTRPGDPRDYLPLAGAASTRVEMFPSPRHAFAVEGGSFPVASITRVGETRGRFLLCGADGGNGGFAGSSSTPSSSPIPSFASWTPTPPVDPTSLPPESSR